MKDPRLLRAARFAMEAQGYEPVNFGGPYCYGGMVAAYENWSKGVTKTLGELGGPDELAFDTEPRIGWRSWRVVVNPDETVRLRSCTYNVHWDPLIKMEAECIPPFPFRKEARPPALNHEAPHRGHTCGIYVTNAQHFAYPWGKEENGQRVIGTAALWGHVVPHDEGWRGKYAYPQKILLPDPVSEAFADIGAKRLAYLLRQTYAVDVEVVSSPSWA